MKKIIHILLLLTFVSNCNELISQSYQPLVDMTGYSYDHSRISIGADSLKANLPQIYNFHVYDFGYYLHNLSMGDIDNIFSNVSGNLSGNYLLIGKASSSNKIYENYKVKLVIPLAACVTQDDIRTKEEELENILNANNVGPEVYEGNLVEALENLKKYFYYLTYECCYSQYRASSSESCGGIPCNNVPAEFINNLQITVVEKEWLLTTPNAKCKAYNCFLSITSDVPIKQKYAMVSASIKLAKQANFAFTQKLKLRNSSLDFDGAVTSSTLSGMWVDYANHKLIYKSSFDKFYDQCGAPSLGVLDWTGFWTAITHPLETISEMICIGIDKIQGVISMISDLTVEEWQVIASMLGTVILEVVLSSLISPYGLYLSMKDAADAFIAKNWFWGSFLLLTGIIGVTGPGKVLGLLKNCTIATKIVYPVFSKIKSNYSGFKSYCSKIRSSKASLRTRGNTLMHVEVGKPEVPVISLMSKGNKVERIIAILNGSSRANVLAATETKNISKLYWNKLYSRLDPKYQNPTDDIGYKLWHEEYFIKSEAGVANFEAHHIIPNNVLKNDPILQDIILYANDNHGFNFNSIENGIMIQKKDAYVGTIHTNHSRYDNIIKLKLENVKEAWKKNEELGYKKLKDLINETEDQLVTQVVNGQNTVNLLNF